MDVPVIKRTDYTVSYITEDGFLSLIDSTGAVKEHLKHPKGTEVGDKIEKMLEDPEATVVVSSLTAMGIEGVVAVKEGQAEK